MQKKQQNKAKKIYRKKSEDEEIVSPEQRKMIREMAAMFRDDQLKKVLEECYHNVQKYGPEAIMKTIDNQWTFTMNDDSKFTDPIITTIIEDDTIECCSSMPRKTSIHDHMKTLKQNAAFLIEASEAIDDYDPATLEQMKAAFEKEDYDNVADLACLHDKSKRNTIFRKCDQKILPLNLNKKICDILTEVVENNDDNSITHHLIGALRELDAPLTYDNRAQAKSQIRKALNLVK